MSNLNKFGVIFFKKGGKVKLMGTEEGTGRIYR